MAKCAREEERLRSHNPDLINHVRQGGHKNNNRGFCSNKNKKNKKPYDSPKQDGPSSSKVPLCHHCKTHGHIKKDYMDFKEWCTKQDNDNIISIVDKSFYAYFPISTWWMDSVATVYVTNSP